MLQITFLALGLSGLLFAVAYFFKKYQRGILWVAALILFIGTSLMLGLGLIKVVENGVANHLAKKMFGDYGIYCDGKIFGHIRDDRFYVKPTEVGRSLLRKEELHPPYEGAKDYFYIADVDDRDYLATLVRVTYKELPEPKKKR